MNTAAFSLPVYLQYVTLIKVVYITNTKVMKSVLTGTGEHASLQGMSMGGTRHAYDEDMSSQSQGMLHPQTGNS